MTPVPVATLSIGAGDDEGSDALEHEYAEQLRRILGPEVMGLFEAEETSELYANPDGRVWSVVHGRGHVPSPHRLRPAQVEGFLHVAAARLGETVTPAHPRLQGELPLPLFGGARLQGVIPPVSAGPMVKVRKRPRRVVPLEEYVTEGVMTAEQCASLRAAVAADVGIVVAGPTSSGKTFLLNAMLREQARAMAPADDPVFVLEDTVEVVSEAPNTVTLRTTPTCDFDVLLQVSLRMTPRYLHVGECRRHALPMLEMWATGHPGFCTVHAASAEGALQRLGRLARRDTGRDEGWLVAHAVGAVVVILPTPGGRRVAEVVRCTGYRRGRYLLARP